MQSGYEWCSLPRLHLGTRRTPMPQQCKVEKGRRMGEYGEAESIGPAREETGTKVWRGNGDSWHSKMSSKIRRQKQEIQRLLLENQVLRIAAEELSQEEQIIVQSFRVHKNDCVRSSRNLSTLLRWQM